MHCSTVRRWREGQSIESWEAHKAAIQAILKLPTGELITGINSSLVLHLAAFIDFMLDFHARQFPM